MKSEVSIAQLVQQVNVNTADIRAIGEWIKSVQPPVARTETGPPVDPKKK